ncbi:hypothetical protein PR003_g2083 [Phytophthora rubi]|uniref:Uncharacterized protein n=1 Tax=Phytophthora rubi TaxID=129364 RepID=A0A6A3NCV7_9STRA|nr:hypothetical protein PR002_g4059 [Phytophthora rubi]KAE9356878.1 hypothetical protein PR003_g2083 [Phytophthora rubi]
MVDSEPGGILVDPVSGVTSRACVDPTGSTECDTRAAERAEGKAITETVWPALMVSALQAAMGMERDVMFKVLGVVAALRVGVESAVLRVPAGGAVGVAPRAVAARATRI